MMIGGIYVSFCMYLGMVKFGLNYFSLCFSVGSGGDFKGSSSRISLINSFFFFLYDQRFGSSRFSFVSLRFSIFCILYEFKLFSLRISLVGMFGVMLDKFFFSFWNSLVLDNYGQYYLNVSLGFIKNVYLLNDSCFNEFVFYVLFVYIDLRLRMYVSYVSVF